MNELRAPGDKIAALEAIKAILGPRLLAQIGHPKPTPGDVLARLAIYTKRFTVRRLNGPLTRNTSDGMILVIKGWPIHAVSGYTLGNYVFARSSQLDRLFMIHEYVHVLQWRSEGAIFLWHYAGAGFWNWPRYDAQGWPGDSQASNRYEHQAMQIEACYRMFPELPAPWQLCNLP
jgi:hypothetical protein